MLNKKMDETIHILMVDDRPDGLLALEAVLSEKRNYRLIKAESGREAYNLLGHYDFAVILMDVQMPEMDGFETAELIRKNPAFNQIPIIFVTAINKDDGYVYRGYETGAVDYIFKPLDPMILKCKVGVFADLHLQKRKLKWNAQQLAHKEALEHQTYVQSLELENLRRYRNLADAIPHMVWRADSKGTLEYYNQPWCNYTGMKLEESMGTGWQRAFNPTDLKALLREWTQAIETGGNFEIECRIRSCQGQYRWHWIKGVAEKDSRGKVIAWLGTCTDIQDRKTAEKKMAEAQKAAESANQAKTHFLANMSHEIRTPLSAIMGFTELMSDPLLSEEEKNANLAVVRRNSHQLLKIIDEILDISKVESGRLETEIIETDLIDLFLGTRSLLEVNATNKGIKLHYEIESKIPDRVLTDATRLRQILMNMVGNAIKFTPSGEIRVRCAYQMDSTGKSLLQVSIVDTGIGVDPEIAERLFTPFLQADPSTTRIYGGTGLGLALSRQLAQALGGNAWLAHSEVGKGSTFVFSIHAEPLEEAVWVTSFEPEAAGVALIESISVKSELEGVKVLLVEDAEDNQVLISHYLKKAGAQVETANNGKEGVEKALSNDYAVVLMDIQMPFLDGYEATTQLRQRGYDKPIIALTAHALREEREKALKTGCNGHLTKPIDRVELIESLKKVSKFPQAQLHS